MLTTNTFLPEAMSVPLTDLTSDYPDLDRKALALLKRIGVTSLVSLISLPVERIAGLLDFPFFKADKLKQSLIEQYCPAPRSGLSLYQVSQIASKFVQIPPHRQHQIRPSYQLAAKHLTRYSMEDWELEKYVRLTSWLIQPQTQIMMLWLRTRWLCGGWNQGMIINKVFGAPATGKTQLCLSAAALCALSGGKVTSQAITIFEHNPL